MASSSADIRLTNLEATMRMSADFPDSPKVLEFGILDVDSSCSPFTQKKLIGATVCHPFPSTWSMPKWSKSVASKVHQHPAIRFHFFSGHAGVVEICTTSWWIFQSSNQQSVTTTKTDNHEWSRETWRNHARNTSYYKHHKIWPKERKKSDTYQNAKLPWSFKLSVCRMWLCHTLRGLGRKGCKIAPHSSWVASDPTFDPKILKLCIDRLHFISFH